MTYARRSSPSGLLFLYLRRGDGAAIMGAEGKRTLAEKGWEDKMDMENKNNSYRKMTEEEIEELFKNARSNLEAPVEGRIYEPACYHCVHQIQPRYILDDPTCEIFGEPPAKYANSDQYPCPYKVLDEHWREKLGYGKQK